MAKNMRNRRYARRFEKGSHRKGKPMRSEDDDRIQVTRPQLPHRARLIMPHERVLEVADYWGVTGHEASDRLLNIYHTLGLEGVRFEVGITTSSTWKPTEE